jgi:ribonuclease J
VIDKKYKDDWLFVPLGGSGEIGMNLNAYSYQGKWVIVDCGAGFADETLPGVDMLVPDVDFLSQRQGDLLGIVLTHAHEDHVGAIQHVWPELRCPIYATPFTAHFLRARLAYTAFGQDVPIHIIDPKEILRLGPFSFDCVSLNHSAPEMHGMVIRTDMGAIFHTGDWKFDPDPLIGLPADEAALRRMGDEGILAMIGDSTNAMSAGSSGSEGALRQSLIPLIGQSKQLVVVATFASNVARLETLMLAAAAANRKVILAGRSLWRIAEAAKAAGYLQDVPPYYEASSLRRWERHEVMVIATGCQGEPLAAATRMSKKEHPDIRLQAGDTIIFSAKIIPGNEKRIFRLFNRFCEQKVHVLTEKDHFVHVSGHPSRDELRRMYQLVRPRVAIPVHGERIHLEAHAALAKEEGVPKALVIENGDVVRFDAEHGASIVGKIFSEVLAIDGHSLIPTEGAVMQTRRRLQSDGALFVAMVLDVHGKLLLDPVIRAPGCLDPKDDRDIMLELVELSEQFVRQCGREPARLEKSLQHAIRKKLQKDIGKSPFTQVEVLVLGG